MNKTKQKSVLFVCVSLVSLFLFSQTSYAQLKHQGPSSSEKLAIQEAQKILEHLQMGNTTYPYAHFDKQMKAALPADQLAQVFSTLEKQCGTYQSATDWNVKKNGIYTIVTSKVQFEKTTLQYLITFDLDDLIAGIFFKPLPK